MQDKAALEEMLGQMLKARKESGNGDLFRKDQSFSNTSKAAQACEEHAGRMAEALGKKMAKEDVKLFLMNALDCLKKAKAAKGAAKKY